MCGGRALWGAGHAVATLHPQEGLVVGHACGEWYKGLWRQEANALCTPGSPTALLWLVALKDTQ